jgi:hypothetical protein
MASRSSPPSGASVGSTICQASSWYARRVDLPGQSARARREGELKNRRFAFQVRLTVESDVSFVPRPNPRGRQDGDDPDERIADLQTSPTM